MYYLHELKALTIQQALLLTTVNCHVKIGTCRWWVKGVQVDVCPSYALQNVRVDAIAFPIIDQPHWIVIHWAVKKYTLA